MPESIGCGGVAGIAVAVGERDQTGVLAFERAQDVVQPFLDPSEIDGGRGGTVAGGFQALQQIGHALFEMGKRRRIVVADRDAVEPFRQRAQRAFEKFRIVARGRRLAVLSSVEVSAAMRCSSMAKASLLPSKRESWSTLADSVCTSSASRASASLEATLETMPRSAAIALSSCCTVDGSSFERRIRSSLAPRLRIASS